jgi:dephospho-CoA kinase
MPGPPVPFTDITILLLYGMPNKGKTTFAHFLANQTHAILPLDPICFSVCDTHSDTLKPFIIDSIPITRQLGNILKKLLKDNCTTILDDMVHDIFINCCKEIDEYIKKHKFIIIEGYILEAVPKLREHLVQYITQNKWRYWICHK